jgi:hypothetical protein
VCSIISFFNGTVFALGAATFTRRAAKLPVL